MSKQSQMLIWPGSETSEREIGLHTPLGSTFQHFERHLRKTGKTAHTINSFRYDLRNLAEWAGLDRPLKYFNHNRLSRYLEWLEYERGVPCSRKTYARRVTTLKVFFGWLKEIGVMRFDPAQELRQRSGAAPLSEVLDGPQTAACYAAAFDMLDPPKRNPRPAMVFHLLLHTGIKKGELESLLIENMRRKYKGISILTILIDGKPNTHKKRRLTITDPHTRGILDAYLEVCKPTVKFFSVRGRELQSDIQKIGKAADLPFELSPEVLRWTYAVNLKLAGVSGDTIRKRLGISPSHWQEVGSKIARIIADKPSLVSHHLRLAEPAT